MTIHDELVRELIKLERWGKPTGKAIINIAGGANIKCVLEETFYLLNPETPGKIDYLKMTPDIVVTNLNTKKTTAIELENDIQWDFAQSLRQIKKYRMNKRDFQNVAVIIPKKYERFAIYYKSQGFDVYLWKATRIWECVDCGARIRDKRTAKPKCSNETCRSSDRELVGLEDVSFDVFELGQIINEK